MFEDYLYYKNINIDKTRKISNETRGRTIKIFFWTARFAKRYQDFFKSNKKAFSFDKSLAL